MDLDSLSPGQHEGGQAPSLSLELDWRAHLCVSERRRRVDLRVVSTAAQFSVDP
jgi:hypothetical protein